MGLSLAKLKGGALYAIAARAQAGVHAGRTTPGGTRYGCFKTNG